MIQTITGLLSTPESESDESAESIGDIEATGERTALGDGASADAVAVVQSILDGLDYPIHVVDDEGYFTRVNQACLDLFEQNEDDLIGQCLFDFEEADNSVMEHVLETGEAVRNQEETITSTTGNVVPVSRSIFPLFDADGEVTGAFEINRDVSNRVALEEREEALERYRAEVLAELEENLERLSDGDLTINPAIPKPDADFAELDAVYDQYSQMAADLAKAVENVNELLAETADRADRLAEVSQSISATAQETTSSISEITGATREIAERSERQSRQADEAEANVSNLSASIEEITASTQEIDALSSRAVDLARDGAQDARSAIERIGTASNASDQNVEMIRALEDRMESVNDTTELIADIADQTNLLALNANIEAARAGEEGAGFAVVAAEVKALAEEAKEAVEEITTTIESLQDGMAETSETIESNNDQVRNGVDAVRKVVTGIEEIEEAVEETNQGVAEIAGATDTQSRHTEEVHQAVQAVSAGSQEVSTGIDQISAGVEQQSDAVEEIAEIATEVSHMSEGTTETLDQFMLDDRAASLSEEQSE